MDYRIFRKPRLKDGKRTYHWKSCKKCRTKAEAEAFIRRLAPLSPGNSVIIRTIGETMYIPNSAHMNRRIQLGKPLTKSSLIEDRAKVRLIIGMWGDRTLASLTVQEVGTYLFAQEKSNSWKRNFLKALRELYAEGYWYGLKIPTPEFPKFAKKSKKADIFTVEEIKRLFVPGNFPTHETYLFFLVAIATGLRLGEAAAVRAKQIIFEYKALIVDGFCRPDGERMNYNKKGTEENPKTRVVPLVYCPKQNSK